MTLTLLFVGWLSGINMENKDVFFSVVSTPRSGTKILAAIFQFMGLDVGHEWVRPNGIVDGFAAWRDPYRKTDWRLDDRRPVECDARLIRHPLDTASTLGLTLIAYPKGIWWTGPKEGTVPADDATKTALRFWVMTHNRIRSQYSIVTTKGKFQGLEQFCHERLSLPVPDYSKLVNLWGRSENRLPRWTWEEWAEKDPEFAKRGKELWTAYGGWDQEYEDGLDLNGVQDYHKHMEGRVG